MRPAALALIAGLALAAGAPRPADAQDNHYRIDQHYGGIEFTVEHLGLFTSHGMFDRFNGRLVVDPAHPERTRLDVDVDAGSVSMPWQDAVTMLRSADFFDVKAYPDIHYVSTAVRQLGPDHYRIVGTLRIRGVTRPQTLDATLLDQDAGTADAAKVADFVVSGTLKRSAFGMVADRVFISDTVRLRILARIVLTRTAPG